MAPVDDRVDVQGNRPAIKTPADRTHGSPGSGPQAGGGPGIARAPMHAAAWGAVLGRTGRRVADFLLRVGRAMWVHRALDSAASMAFNFFLSLIPLLVLVGFVLGHLVRTNGVDVFMAPVLDAIPKTSADLVAHELQRMAGARAESVAPLGVLTFFWLASSGVHHMMSVFEKAVRASPRRWIKQRAIALACVVAGLASTGLASWCVFEADAIVHRESPRVPQLSFSWNGRSESARVPGSGIHESRSIHGQKKALMHFVHRRLENLSALAFAVVFGVSCLSAFYRYAVEHPAGHRRRSWPGAWAAFAAWLVVSWAFGNYVISLGEYAVYYGSLAAVAVLLLWLYLTSLSLLLGAEVNAILEGVSGDVAPASERMSVPLAQR
jgi:membrane protein